MSAEARPPKLARLLVRLTAAPEDRDLLLADLEERFAATLAGRGPAAARRWYWSQALRGTLARLRPDGEAFRAGLGRGALGDLRIGIRALARRPLYSVGVAGTLAIGLASAAAVTAVAWHVWLAPLPYPDPDRVVRLYELEPAGEGAPPDVERTRWRLAPPTLEDLRAHDWTTVDAVAGISSNNFDWVREGTVSTVSALVVSPEAFEILGLAPLVGRPISYDEDAPEVVLSRAFWERAYGSDPSVVDGGALTLGGESHAVVGVVELPVGYPRSADMIVRMSFGEDQLVADMRGARYLDVIARVDPAHGVEEAAGEMDRIVASLGERFGNHAGWGGTAVPLSDELMRPYRGVLGLLLAAGGIFLALAVVNVVGLVAARTVEGRRDRAVRLALGASEGRLLRGSWTESMVLGALGGGVAILLAYLAIEPIRALVPPEVPRIENVRLGALMTAVVLGISLAAGWAVGVLGYLFSRGEDPAVGRAHLGTRRSTVGRAALVASQVALTTLLATGGSVILRHISGLRSIDLGFEPDGVVASQVILSSERYQGKAAWLQYWRSVLEAIRGDGLVVGVGTNAPMSNVNMPWGYRRDATSDQRFAQYHPVTGGYFAALGIELLDGRTFTDDDREDSEPVVIVNEMLARSQFPGESAVGRTIRVLNVEKTIVGVVASARHRGPSEDVPEEIYAPAAHDPWPHAQVLVRGEESLATAALARALEQVDATIEPPAPAPYARYVRDWFATLRLQAIIVGVLAGVGTLLAGLGLYALVAYHVTTRRREMGVRLALGASGERLFSHVVRRGLGLALAGMTAGFALWYALAGPIRSLLGDADALDPLASAAVAVFIGAISFLASALPAARSVSVDPAITLRAE